MSLNNQCLIKENVIKKKVQTAVLASAVALASPVILAQQNVEERVKATVVEHLGVEASEVTADADFVTDLGADSLDTVELVMEFEEKFDIEISDQDAESLVTIGDVIKYIKDKTK